MNTTSANVIPDDYRHVLNLWYEDKIPQGLDENTEIEEVLRLYREISDDGGAPHKDTPYDPEELYRMRHVGQLSMDESAVIALANERGQGATKQLSLGLLLRTLWPIFAILGAVILIGWFIFSRGGSPSEPTTPTVQVTRPITGVVTNTEIVSDTQQPLSSESIPPPVDINALSAADDFRALEIDVPLTLDIKHQNETNSVFSIAPTEVNNLGSFPFITQNTELQSETAVWIYGSAINYLFGINEFSIDKVDVGDEVILRGRTGNIRRFLVTEKPKVGVQEFDFFRQNLSPRVTLFPLPYTRAQGTRANIPIVIAEYQPQYETSTLEVRAGLNTDVVLADNLIRATEVRFTQQSDSVQVNVKGTSTEKLEQVSLFAKNRYPSQNSVSNKNDWRSTFIVPVDAIGENSVLQFQNQQGVTAEIGLGRIPDLESQMKVNILQSYVLSDSTGIKFNLVFEVSGDNELDKFVLEDENIAIVFESSQLPFVSNLPVEVGGGTKIVNLIVPVGRENATDFVVKIGKKTYQFND